MVKKWWVILMGIYKTRPKNEIKVSSKSIYW